MFNSLRRRASSDLENHEFFKVFGELSSIWRLKFTPRIEPSKVLSIIDRLEVAFLDLKNVLTRLGIKLNSPLMQPPTEIIYLRKVENLIFFTRDAFKAIEHENVSLASQYSTSANSVYDTVLILTPLFKNFLKENTGKDVLRETLLSINQDENETERLLKEEQDSWNRMRDNLILETEPPKRTPSVRKTPTPKTAPVRKTPTPKTAPVKKTPTPKTPSAKLTTPRKAPIKLTALELAIENEFSHLNSYLDFNNLSQPELMEFVLRMKPSMDKVVRNDEYAVYDKKMKPSVSKSGLLPVTLINQFTKTLKNLNTLYDLGDLEPIELITSIEVLLPIFNKVPAFKITDKKAMWLGY